MVFAARRCGRRGALRLGVCLVLTALLNVAFLWMFRATRSDSGVDDVSGSFYDRGAAASLVAETAARGGGFSANVARASLSQVGASVSPGRAVSRRPAMYGAAAYFPSERESEREEIQRAAGDERVSDSSVLGKGEETTAEQDERREEPTKHRHVAPNKAYSTRNQGSETRTLNIRQESVVERDTALDGVKLSTEARRRTYSSTLNNRGLVSDGRTEWSTFASEWRPGQRKAGPTIPQDIAQWSKNFENCSSMRGKSISVNPIGGYLISLDYDQQLMGSFKAFYHLAMFASLFNLSIVEPYIYGKGRLGVPIVRPSREPVFLKLTDFYDHHQIACALSFCAKSKFSSFEEFVERTSPHVVLVSFLPSLKGYESFFVGEEKVIEIRNITEKLLNQLAILNDWTSFNGYEERVYFRWSRVILIDARPLHIVTLQEIKEKLVAVVHQQIQNFGRATIVLDNWRDIGSHSHYFYSIRGFTNVSNCEEILTTGHSKTVMDTAREFSGSLNLTIPVVGVHVRGEILLIYSEGSRSYYTHCLRQLRNLLESSTLPNLPYNGSVVLFHDLGKYGSISCHHYKDCLEQRSNFLSLIGDLGYKVVYFEPLAFQPALLRSVFAAFVEKEFLSRVDVLVTVGLGNYQQNIVDRFLHYSGGVGKNLHRLCFSTHHRKHHSSHNIISTTTVS